jgi:hypothetical protein
MIYHNESLRGITTKYNLETTEEAAGTSANTETDCDKDERLKKMYDLLKFDNVVRGKHIKEFENETTHLRRELREWSDYGLHRERGGRDHGVENASVTC